MYIRIKKDTFVYLNLAKTDYRHIKFLVDFMYVTWLPYFRCIRVVFKFKEKHYYIIKLNDHKNILYHYNFSFIFNNAFLGRLYNMVAILQVYTGSIQYINLGRLYNMVAILQVYMSNIQYIDLGRLHNMVAILQEYMGSN